MEKVTGIGGFFFRSDAPETLAEWYQKHLGVDISPSIKSGPPWVTEAGVTVFAPFEKRSDYFAADKTWMLNFRVNDLDAMMAQLRAADIEVALVEEMEGVGRFAHMTDPEGNPIELWQPAPMPG